LQDFKFLNVNRKAMKASRTELTLPVGCRTFTPKAILPRASTLKFLTTEFMIENSTAYRG
jgi:hypothetical protein